VAACSVFNYLKPKHHTLTWIKVWNVLLLQNLSFKQKKGTRLLLANGRNIKSTPREIGRNGRRFAYTQNIPLPQIPLQEVFYYRQLLINEFFIRNNEKQQSIFLLVSRRRGTEKTKRSPHLLTTLHWGKMYRQQ